jgi:uncharacterized protein (TIGR00251 family)
MFFEAHASGTILSVRVVPRSSKSRIDGVVDGLLRVRLTAPPVDGAANAALIELISAACGVPKSHVSILTGERAKQKRLLVRGIDVAQVRECFGLETD